MLKEELSLAALSVSTSESCEHSSPEVFDQCKAAAECCWGGV